MSDIMDIMTREEFMEYRKSRRRVLPERFARSEAVVLKEEQRHARSKEIREISAYNSANGIRPVKSEKQIARDIVSTYEFKYWESLRYNIYGDFFDESICTEEEYQAIEESIAEDIAYVEDEDNIEKYKKAKKYLEESDTSTITYIKVCPEIANIFEIEPSSGGSFWWVDYVEWMRSTHLLDNTPVYEGLLEEKEKLLATKQLTPEESDVYKDYLIHTISRYEMAQIVYNLGHNPRSKEDFIYFDVDTTGVANKIPDYESIPAQYREAVEYCYATGLMTGISDGTLTSVRGNLKNLDDATAFDGDRAMSEESFKRLFGKLSSAKEGYWEVPINN